VGGGNVDVVVAGRARRLEHHAVDRATAAAPLQGIVGERLDELDLLGEAEHRPRETARPRAERRVALLGARSAIRAVGGVEQALVRRASADVEAIAAAAIVDAPL